MSQTNHGGARPGAGRPRGSASDAHRRYGEARARKETALAELREMQAAKTRGELIPADIVLDRWSQIAATVRQRLLAIPTKVAGLAAHRSAGEVESIVKTEIYAVLTEFSELPRYTE